MPRLPLTARTPPTSASLRPPAHARLQQPETARSASNNHYEQDSAFTEAFNSVTPVSVQEMMQQQQKQ